MQRPARQPCTAFIHRRQRSASLRITWVQTCGRIIFRLDPYPRSVLAAVVIALIVLVLFGRLASPAMWAQILSDAAHGPVSAAIAILFMLMMGARGPAGTARQGLIAIAITTLIGILIELVQSRIGRDAELSDVITGSLGAVAGTGLFVFVIQYRVSQTAQRCSTWLISGVCGLLATAVLSVPVVTMVSAYVAKQLRGPVLVDANVPLGTYFIGTHWIRPRVEPLPAAWQAASGKNRGYHVKTNNDPKWGLSFQEFHPDWRAWRSLSVELINPCDVPLHLNVRVFDREDGLSNRIGHLTPITLSAHSHRVTHIAVPAMTHPGHGQPVDTHRIRGIVISAAAGNQAPDFYLLKLWLQ